MPRLALLDPTETGRQAEDLEDKTRHLIVGQEETIHQIARISYPRLSARSPLKQNLRNAVFVAIVVCGNLVGNVLLRAGMRRSTALPALAPMAYLNALLNSWVLVGVLLLIVGLAAQLALLSWADLSYVAPVTSIGYVLTVLAGKLFLHEPFSAPRWAAIFLITAGVTLVSRTLPSTAGGECYRGRQ
jgi:drug/metabolite transporter (DMT)-like permease